MELSMSMFASREDYWRARAVEAEGDLHRIRKVVTQWNFGPMPADEALLAIFEITGDDIQNELVP